MRKEDDKYKVWYFSDSDHGSREDIPRSAALWWPGWWRWESCGRMRRRQLKPVSHRFYPRTLHKEFIERSVSSVRCEFESLAPTDMKFHLFEGKYQFKKQICCTKHLSGRWSTFQHILLHLNLIEFVGANNNAVASEVDTATGFWCLDLLQIQGKVQTFPLWFITLPFISQANPPFGCRTCSSFRYVEEL